MVPSVARESALQCKPGLTVAFRSGRMYVIGRAGLDNGNSG